MMPIDQLMSEHRLIERMIKLMRVELRKIKETNEANPSFISAAVDFLRMYADLCHHGKEEGILFEGLVKKGMSDEHRNMMYELIKEHVYARKTVSSLENARESYVKGNTNSLKDILKLINELVELYPMHIEKEDKRFFHPCMKYFTEQEQEEMLQKFWDFDRKMIHEKYQQVVEKLEKN